MFAGAGVMMRRDRRHVERQPVQFTAFIVGPASGRKPLFSAVEPSNRGGPAYSVERVL